MKHYIKLLSKLLLYSIFIYLVLVILEYSRQGFINDLSLQKIDLNDSDLSRKPVYLISYADGGRVFYQNQNAMSHYAINKGVDFILNYRKRHISHEFIENNQEIFNDPKGAGMWLWKPYIIAETMKSAPEESIIIYFDSAFYINKSLNGLIEMLGDKDVLLVQDRNRKNGQFVKGDSFSLMNCLSQECRSAPHIWSAAIVLRNTKLARSFIEQWLKNSQDIRILSAKNYEIMANYPEYSWHHFDQSVLSLVAYKNSESVKVINFEETKPFLSWCHRKSSLSSPLKSWYSMYGSDPLINFSVTGKTLPSSALLNFPLLVNLRKWFIERFM
jgi:hypothetical protein